MSVEMIETLVTISPTGSFAYDHVQSDPPQIESASLEPIRLPTELQFAAARDPRLRFKRALRVRLYKDGEAYIAYSDELETFGYGSNMSEALDDLSRTVSEMYFYLVDEFSGGRLGEDLVQKYQVITGIVEQNKGHVKAI